MHNPKSAAVSPLQDAYSQSSLTQDVTRTFSRRKEFPVLTVTCGCLYSNIAYMLCKATYILYTPAALVYSGKSLCDIDMGLLRDKYNQVIKITVLKIAGLFYRTLHASLFTPYSV